MGIKGRGGHTTMTFSTQLQRKLVCNDVHGVILPLLNLLQHQVHIQGGGALAYFQGNVFGEKVSGGKLLYLSPYTPTMATVPASRTHWEAVPMADLDGVVALAVFSAAAELAPWSYGLKYTRRTFPLPDRAPGASPIRIWPWR